MGMKRGKATPPQERTGQPSEDLPERWSAQRKMELVLRLLRGPVDAVSHESQVPAHELESWKRVFLETGARRERGRCPPTWRRAVSRRAPPSPPGQTRGEGAWQAQEGVAAAAGVRIL